MKKSEQEELREILDRIRREQRSLKQFSDRLDQAYETMDDKQKYGAKGEALEDELSILEDGADILDEALNQMEELL